MGFLKSSTNERFELFTAVKVQVEVFWVVTSWDTNVSEIHADSIFRVKHGPLKRWYRITALNDGTTQKTSTWNVTAVKASN